MPRLPTRLEQARRFWFYLSLELLMVAGTILRFLPGWVPDFLKSTSLADGTRQLGFWPSLSLILVQFLLIRQIKSVIMIWRRVIRGAIAEHEMWARIEKVRVERERLEQKG